MAGYFDDDANAAAFAKLREKAMASRTAPVSPIATQETPDQIAQRAVDELRRYWGGGSPVFEPALQDVMAEAIRDALSSAERRIEELVGERDHFKALWQNARDSLASLTGQVEAALKMKAAGDDEEAYTALSWAMNPRSLPVLPTTGDGGGFVETHGYSSDPRKLRLLLEGRDNFIVDRGLWSEFVDTLPTGRETSGEET